MNASASRQLSMTSVLHAAGFTAIAVVAWYCIFILPFTAAAAPAKRLKSTSYALGFDNRIALGAVVLIIGAITVWLLRRRVTPVRWCPCAPEPVSKPVLLTVAALYLLATFGIYAIARAADWYGLDWESSHFLWRLKLTTTYGLRPYTGYQFEYGPALAYIPVMAYRLLKPAGATPEFSYYCSHYLLNLAGLLSIAFVLARVAMPARGRNIAFVALGCAAFLPNMGLNGVVLRYTAPFFGLVVVHQAANCSRRWRAVRVFAASIVSIAICATLSAEIGIAFGLVLAVYGVLSIRNRSVAGPILTAIVLAGLLAPVLLPEEYYASLSHFSQGGNNLPLLPTSPHLLLYLAVMICITPQWLAAVAAPASDRLLTFGCGLLTVALAPGALGRSDPYHLMFYGLGSSLLAFITLSNSGKRVFRTYTVVYLLVFGIGLELINAWVFRVTPRAIAAGINRTITAAPPPSPDLTPLLKYPQLALPYGSYGYTKHVQQWLWGQKKIAPEYFMGGMGIYTEDQMNQRLDDLGRFRYVLVMDSYRSLHRAGSHEPCVADWWYLRKALLYPWHLPCVRPSLDPDGEISQFLEHRYHVIENVGDYVVLERDHRDGSRSGTARPPSGPKSFTRNINRPFTMPATDIGTCKEASS